MPEEPRLGGVRVVIEAMDEAKVTASASFDSVKKLEAAKMAAKALQDTGWLPEPLRPRS